MRLYGYFRSSASYRVRIALHLKGLDFEHRPVHLVRGEQSAPDYARLSPDGLVPLLETEGGEHLSQSLAIIEYLEECFPQVPLLPVDPAGRARVRAMAQTIACEIHPVNNLRVLNYLQHELAVEPAARTVWYRHWVRLGLEAFERQLAGVPASLRGRFCHGDAPTLADCCLVPQIFNARRFDCDLSGLPRSLAAYEACMALGAFRAAAPEACPDAG
ncbi:maleylacetoacetate isomerase [Xylophilus sp. Kf1]|nr:maleylacetoacetate isomerase [Xylophilus sp. Kf1]